MTVADVHRWVKKGFADALGKSIPDDLYAATEQKARNDEARNFPDKSSSGGGSAEIARVGAVVGMVRKRKRA